MYIYAGGGADGPLNDMHVYHMAENRWEMVPYANPLEAPHLRRYHSMCLHGQCLYIFGGWDGASYLNDLFSFDLESCVWTRLTGFALAPSVRCYHTCVAFGDSLYVFGGTGVRHLNDVWRYCVPRNQWSKIKPQGRGKPRRRYAHTAVMCPEAKMVVFGGCQARIAKFFDVHVFDCGTHLWTRFNPVNAPSPRSSHSACLDAKRGTMIVFGGYDGHARFSHLHRLPMTLHWTPQTHALLLTEQQRAQIFCVLLCCLRSECPLSTLPQEILFHIFRLICYPPVMGPSSSTSSGVSQLQSPLSDGDEHHRVDIVL